MAPIAPAQNRADRRLGYAETVRQHLLRDVPTGISFSDFTDDLGVQLGLKIIGPDVVHAFAPSRPSGAGFLFHADI